MFERWSEKFKLSWNWKHHKKRLKKTLVVIFSNFGLLIIFKSPLKNLTNNIFLLFTKFLIYNGFLHCFYIILVYMFSATLKNTIKNITRQEGNVLSDLAISAQKYAKIITKEWEKFKESATLFFKTTFFLQSFYLFSNVLSA